MEGDAPVLMATTSLSGIVNLIYEVHAGSLAATISPTLGAAGRAGFMAGTHGTRPCAAVPHGSGARVWGVMVVAFPEIAKAHAIEADLDGEHRRIARSLAQEFDDRLKGIEGMMDQNVLFADAAEDVFL